VLKIISEKYEDCSVVMISGDAALDRINKASELGAIDFIVKPFKTEAVEKKLSKITKKLFK
jgi:response regulator of citrate/malate metabolism